MSTRFDVFLEPEALRINRARLEHLTRLGLDLDSKRVLEVGAGIGLLTEFFEQRGCDVLSTEGNPINVAEMLRRYSERRLGVLDLDNAGDLSGLGVFDVVFCYGTLCHLHDPDAALARLAAICTGMILLETIVSRGAHAELHMARESPCANQALGGIGCRPTRPWVMGALARHFGHAYTTSDQPEYPDFVTDWSVVSHTGNLRAVFVGSRQPLAAASLTRLLPIRHRNAPPRTSTPPPARVRIDVGAHRGDYSRCAAMQDPELVVHAFEPLPTLYEELREGPTNHRVHASAIAEQEGVAPFHVNRFAAASSLLPIDEDVRREWTDGDLLHEDRIVYVPTTRLDRFMQRSGIRHVEFLHIDAQGADLAVLRSAGERLADIDQIKCEVAVTPEPLYLGAPSKTMIVDFLVARGFRLVAAEAQSHGQEENLTFVREPAEPRHDRAAPKDDAGEAVAGIYELDRAIASPEEAWTERGSLEITTAPQQWMYTAVIRLGTVGAERADQRVRVTLEVEVEQGAVQVGILNRDESDFPVAMVLTAEPGWQTVSLVTPELQYAGPLVIRNASPDGPSRARCRRLAVTTLPEVAVQASEETLGPADAAFLAAEIGAAASALAPAAALQPEIATAVAPSVRAAVEQMRGLLLAQGCALVDIMSPELTATLGRLGPEALHGLAADLAFLHPLRPMPSWRYDSFLESSDPATFVRYAIWRTARSSPPPRQVVIPWHGGSRFGIVFDNELGQQMFVSGCYEPNEFALLDRVLRPGMTALDAGANEGTYTVFLAARVGPKGRVLAVEPSPRELARLRANLALNDAVHVTVVAAALAERQGEAALKLADARHAGQNTLGGFIYPEVTESGHLIVPATTIDMLAETQRLDRLDVIKLDVEGAELAALAGAAHVLEAYRPLLLLEASDAALRWQGGSLEALLDRLGEAGYLLYRFDTETGLPVPLPGEKDTSHNLVAVHRERRFGL